MFIIFFFPFAKVDTIIVGVTFERLSWFSGRKSAVVSRCSLNLSVCPALLLYGSKCQTLRGEQQNWGEKNAFPQRLRITEDQLTPWSRGVLKKLIVDWWIPRIVWNEKVHYRVHMSLTLVFCPNQMNLVHAVSSYFIKIRFTNMLPPRPRSSKWSLSFRFTHCKPCLLVCSWVLVLGILHCAKFLKPKSVFLPRWKSKIKMSVLLYWE